MTLDVILAKEHKALVIPRISPTVNMFPSAPRLSHADQERLLVPHDLHTYLILRQLGLPSPHPMPHYYDWRGGSPFAVQKATCEMLTANPRSYVLNDMGTGKTRAALWAWDYLHGNKLAGKLLVVAPLSTLNFVWAREVFATLPGITVQVLHGTKKQRLERLAAEADIYVINHDGLKVIYPELQARKDIDALVLDELAVYRNNSDRFKMMRSFATRFKFVWGMTGSPMPNEPTDVWSQCRIVTPWSVPERRTHARDMLMTKVSQHIYRPKPTAVNDAFKWMQPSVRFSLDDVTELPEVVVRTIDVANSPDQERIYKSILDDFRAEMANKTVTAVNAAAAMGKLLQIAGGWVYAGAHGVLDMKPDARLDALVDLIDSNERKVIVFVPYRHAIEGIAKKFDAAGIEHAIVHGDISNRDEIFNLFQNTAKYKVLLAHPQCVAHGLTLTAADTTIWYGPTASLEIFDQANARIRRVGQKHRQQVLLLQSTPIEKRIYALLRRKASLQDNLLNLFEEASMALLDAA